MTPSYPARPAHDTWALAFSGPEPHPVTTDWPTIAAQPTARVTAAWVPHGWNAPLVHAMQRVFHAAALSRVFALPDAGTFTAQGRTEATLTFSAAAARNAWLATHIVYDRRAHLLHSADGGPVSLLVPGLSGHPALCGVRWLSWSPEDALPVRPRALATFTVARARLTHPVARAMLTRTSTGHERSAAFEGLAYAGTAAHTLTVEIAIDRAGWVSITAHPIARETGTRETCTHAVDTLFAWSAAWPEPAAWGEHMRETVWAQVRVQGAYLRGADMPGADTRDADMQADTAESSLFARPGPDRLRMLSRVPGRVPGME
jgi:hypothetical protein